MGNGSVQHDRADPDPDGDPFAAMEAIGIAGESGIGVSSVSERLYRELGVSKTASAEDIQSAYRKLAKKYHPDANHDDRKAEEKFKKISAAYAILKDRDTRARYDRGEIDDAGNERAPFGFGGGMGGGFHGERGHGANSTFEFRAGGGFDDILNDIFGGFSQTGASGNGRKGSRRDMRGSDIVLRTSIDFVKAAAGGSERIRTRDGRNIDVNGTQLRLRGKGQPGAGDASAGDLLLEVEVRPHPAMRRENLDIHVDQPVPLELAVNGGKIRVATISGEVALNVPAWSSSGRILRLRGRGIHDRKAGKKGDQLVRLMITLPEKPDPDLEALCQRSRAETD